MSKRGRPLAGHDGRRRADALVAGGIALWVAYQALRALWGSRHDL